MLHTPLNAAGIETDPPSYRSRSASEIRCDAMALLTIFSTEPGWCAAESHQCALPYHASDWVCKVWMDWKSNVPPEEPPDERLRLYGFAQYPMMLLYVSGDCYVSAYVFNRRPTDL